METFATLQKAPLKMAVGACSSACNPPRMVLTPSPLLVAYRVQSVWVRTKNALTHGALTAAVRLLKGLEAVSEVPDVTPMGSVVHRGGPVRLPTHRRRLPLLQRSCSGRKRV